MYLALPLLAHLLSLSIPVQVSGALVASDTVRTITGQVFPADDGPAGDLRVFVRGVEFTDSTATDSTGRFSISLPADLPDDTVELVTDAADRTRRLYHPALARLRRADLDTEQRIVLVPRRWTISSGSYAGRSVEISPDRALLPVCAGCAGFYPRRDARGGVSGHPFGRTWPEARFPLRVAFDRENSDQRITPADSTAFWNTVAVLEQDVGDDLFRPVRYAETLAVEEDAPSDVVLVWIVPSMRWSGLGTRGYADGNINFAAVWIRGTALLHSTEGRAVLTHELIHALGYGHTCSWRSVMAVSEHCSARKADSATPEDVAYMQLARRVRALQERYGTRWGIGAAHDGERTTLMDFEPTREPSADRLRP